MGPVEMDAFNRTVYAALKPAGFTSFSTMLPPKDRLADVTTTLHRD